MFYNNKLNEIRRRPMLSKKGRLLYALHTVKTLFRDAGIGTTSRKSTS